MKQRILIYLAAIAVLSVGLAIDGNGSSSPSFVSGKAVSQALDYDLLEQSYRLKIASERLAATHSAQ